MSVLGIYFQKNKYSWMNYKSISTISQWLIFLRKTQSFKLNLHEAKHYLLILIMGQVITLFANRKFNYSLKVPASVQSFPDSPG